MIGRQVMETNRAFTLEELYAFMQEHWNAEEYNDFCIGRPTPASIEEYILLPATPRFMVCAYPRKAGSFFSKKNRVVLVVCGTPEGVGESLARSVRSRNILVNAWQLDSTLSSEKERKGPAEDALQFYAAHMRELLGNAGYLV